MRSDGVWILQPSDWPSGWSAVWMYSRATAHMRTCAMRIRVAWRSPVPVYPHTLCVYPHSADEGIVSPRVSHPMDDISDVFRVMIPLTMILGLADPRSLICYSQHLCIPGYRVRVCCTTPRACTCMQHTASGCSCCTPGRVACTTSHIPYSGCPIPGVPGSWTHQDLMDLRSSTLHLMIPGS